MLTVVVAAIGGVLALALVRSARRGGPTARARGIRRPRRLRLPVPVRRRVARVLVDAGSELTPEAAMGWWALGATGMVAVGAGLGPATAMLAAAGAVTAVPVLVSLGRDRMRRALDEAVPTLLERTAIELRGGGTVSGALEGADLPPALALTTVTGGVARGASFTDALDLWADRLGRADVRAAAGALGLAATVGGRAAGALDGLASSLRARLAAAADARAQAAQARLSAIVVGAAPVAFLVFSVLTDPDALGALLGTDYGRFCLGVGLGLQALAVVWIRHILASRP